MTLFLRRTIFAFVLGAALATAVFVGRAAHATTGQIDACFKPSNGTLYSSAKAAAGPNASRETFRSAGAPRASTGRTASA